MPLGAQYFLRPLRYLVALGFPVVFPFLVLLVISKSYLESLKSAHRIKVLLLDPQHSERIVAESFIERATHTLEEVMENNMAQSPSHASTPASSGASTPQGAKVSMYGSRDALRRQKEDDDLQPQWTGAQLRMLDNLATVDKMNKHFAWFPDILTGHGTIICRAPMFGDEYVLSCSS